MAVKLTDHDQELFEKADAALARVRDLSAQIHEQVAVGDSEDLRALVHARKVAQKDAKHLVEASTMVLAAKGWLS